MIGIGNMGEALATTEVRIASAMCSVSEPISFGCFQSSAKLSVPALPIDSCELAVAGLWGDCGAQRKPSTKVRGIHSQPLSYHVLGIRSH